MAFLPTNSFPDSAGSLSHNFYTSITAIRRKLQHVALVCRSMKNHSVLYFFGLAATIVTILGAISNSAAQQSKDPFIKDKRAETTDADPGTAETFLTGNILVEVEYIEVPKENLTQYTRDPGFGTDATPLRKEVQKWIADGDASVLEISLLSTRSGQRAKVESIRECIYPANWAKTGSPTVMETRNEGTTVEVDPVKNSDGSAIALNIAPEITVHLGESPALPKPEWLQDGDFHIPHFYTLRTTTAADCRPEGYTLLGSKASFENAKDRLVLVFARCGLTGLRSSSVHRPAANQLNFSFEWVEVPTDLLSEWLFNQNLSNVPAIAHNVARKWKTDGKATIAEFTTVQTRTGQRSKNESISEVIYPEAYVGSESGPRPQSYETRNQGTTVEIDPVTAPDGLHVEMNLAPEIVKLVGNSVLHRSRKISGGPWIPDVTMPLFYTTRFTTAAIIAEDEPTLLAIMTPPGEDGKANRTRKWLFFVTARR